MEKAVAFDPATEERIAADGSPDVLIIGSGMGGATLAAGLAPSGRRIVILERGERLEDCPEARDPAAIFGRGHFRPNETWHDADGRPFNPGNYAFVGGNSKFYGAVLLALSRGRFPPVAPYRRHHARLADRLWRSGALLRQGRGAVSRARRCRGRSDRAAAFRRLPLPAGAGRA